MAGGGLIQVLGPKRTRLMETPAPRKLWPIRSRQNFVVSTIVLMAFVVFGSVLSGSPSDQPQTAFELLPFLGVVIFGGFTSGLVFWEIFFGRRSR